MTNVRIEHGVLAGVERDGVHAFLGIPYAAPPVGDRRWRPPAPPASWDGIREATAFGPAAVPTADTGMDLGAPQSEDCLYLNVWTTALSTAQQQPVMVWIHGGGFLNGSASLGLWRGDHLCRAGVTVVSLNYRLGAFGFLSHPNAGANFGVQDWVAALNWVQANIGAFGGDPDNITVFGQSAGGAAVRALLSTPAATGLFHRAIIQSAGFEDYAVIGSPSYQRSTTASAKLLERLGASDLDDLRQAPTEAVREASLTLSGIFPPPGQVHTPANLVWYPVVDDAVMEHDLSGWPEDVPVMLGCTQDEARMFVQPTSLYGHPEVRAEDTYTPETLAHMAEVLAGRRADAVLAHYAAEGMTPYEAIAELITAAVWHEPAWATLQRFAQLNRVCYAYRFARVSPGALQSGLLAKHSAEIPYLFGTMVPADAYDEIDAAVAGEVQHAWTEFARTGVPRSLDGTPWPVYRPDGADLAWIGDTTAARPLAPNPVTELIASSRAGTTQR
ncbi:MAG: carboxylesterase/lipase family protein [Jatrophihabitans sp.]